MTLIGSAKHCTTVVPNAAKDLPEVATFTSVDEKRPMFVFLKDCAKICHEFLDIYLGVLGFRGDGMKNSEYLQEPVQSRFIHTANLLDPSYASGQHDWP